LPIESNELVRRLKSKEAGDRMPLEADALSAESIQTIIRWIEEGATWPDSSPQAPRLAAGNDVWNRLLNLAANCYDHWQIATILPAVYILFGVLVGVLILSRAHDTRRKQLAQRRPVSRWVALVSRVSWGYPLAGVFAAALYGGFLYTTNLRAALTTTRNQ